MTLFPTWPTFPCSPPITIQHGRLSPALHQSQAQLKIDCPVPYTDTPYYLRVEQKNDDSIWGVDETNSAATSRTEKRRLDLGSRRDELGRDETNNRSNIHDETIWEVDATNSVDNEANRSNSSTSRNTNFVSNLTS